ncbi:hypothetical protein GCM10014715_60580 [Streptomyces spiralis]|uniref:DUF4331 domain-containing protein n=1 Tax=Streptomyces spiralis TaxID=66376 RepID=A0A919AA02_9ACTN|nr:MULTISPECIES: DUF4331 domain-containing protein [Streptomyces]GHE96100.1 hypothetical protein GCM10014715_60580 [Streptomyces spiralis]
MTPLISRSGAGRKGLVTLICGALAAGGLAAAGVATLEPGAASASSHREAPLISGTPQYDNTDVYAFVSPDKPDTTTIVANWIPFEEPAGGPNFYTFADDAQYDIHIDSNGDAQGELLFRYTFRTHRKNGNTFLYNTGPVTSLDDPDLNITQTYDIDLIRLKNQHVMSRTKLADDVPVAPSNVGKASMPDYAKLRYQAVHRTAGGAQTFAGQADDPFFLDLRVFDLLYGGNLSEVGNDTLKGYNVNTIALQVPNDLIRESAEQPVVGIWSTTQRRNAQGYYTQVSRLGNPLVNEVVNPQKDKDKFNASSPWNDAQFLKNVTNPELPKLIEAIYKIKAPAEPRNDLVDVFLKGVKGLNQPPNVRPAEELRLNTSIKPSMHPKRLGVLDGDNAGFPNGRRLTDDVIDASLQVVEGELVGSKNDLGDAVDANDKKFEKSFPYVAEPTSGSRGPLAKGTTGGADVRSQIGDALKPVGSSSGGSGDTVLIAASAASGAAGILLIGTALAWWRRRMQRPY